MGLCKSKPYYVTDRGDATQLDEMKVSHILNAINHHRTQIDTIDFVLEDATKSYRDFNNVHRRRMALHDTVEALITELLTRDPDDDNDCSDY